MRTLTQHARRCLGREDGQAFVEFALVLPLLVLLVFGITQFGLTFRNYLTITDAARVGARAAAVSRTNSPCTKAWDAIRASLTPAQETDVLNARPSNWCDADSKDSREQFTIVLKYPFSIGLPGVSASGDLTAKASERME